MLRAVARAVVSGRTLPAWMKRRRALLEGEGRYGRRSCLSVRVEILVGEEMGRVMSGREEEKRIMRSIEDEDEAIVTCWSVVDKSQMLWGMGGRVHA